MTSSLVGSEMCIRDSEMSSTACTLQQWRVLLGGEGAMFMGRGRRMHTSCLLYTSDAADDMHSV
eukprot:11356527-Prorocentrum_lima.AAC.1